MGTSNDVIGRLTAEQALRIIQQLSRRGDEIGEAVRAEAMEVLTGVDRDETAEEVFCALDALDVEDCWDRSGASRDGYTSPDEAAAEMIEAELQPFCDQQERYQELDMSEQESAYCMGVILGLYRFARESESEFRDWSTDIPAECARDLLDQWLAQNREARRIDAMRDFIREYCPEWATCLLEK
jgi:hypothetical protein